MSSGTYCMAPAQLESHMMSLSNSKGNAETKRFLRTLKEEFLWLEEFASLDEAHEKVAAWLSFYNTGYLHSALGYKSPQEYDRLYQEENLKNAA